MPTLKLEDAVFVGDYLKQQIENFCKKYPEMNEKLLQEFVSPIQIGMEKRFMDLQQLRLENETLKAHIVYLEESKKLLEVSKVHYGLEKDRYRDALLKFIHCFKENPNDLTNVVDKIGADFNVDI